MCIITNMKPNLFLKLHEKIFKQKKYFLLVPVLGSIFLIYFVYIYLTLAPALARADLNSKLPITTKILARDGRLLYEVGGPVQRNVVTSEQIPQLLKDATVAAEDRNFYKHSGIDFKAIARALMVDIKSGRIEQGGSTITQQMVKNTFLNSERTVARKIKEAAMAVIIESRLSKEEIMTAYLNNVPYGGNIMGVGKATEIYFGKAPVELTVAEAAMLAVLPRSPSFLSPYNRNR